MNRLFKKHLLASLGWFFVVLGGIGLLLPLLPTTPFLLIASALFAKSSPRFHRMLLSNRWFGPVIREWETTRTLSRKIKYKASFLIIFVFLISIIFLKDNIYLVFLLVGIALALLFFLWGIKEKTG